MKLEFDFSELETFGSELLFRLKRAERDALYEIAEKLYVALKQFTPVKSGKLRSGWRSGNFQIQLAKDGYFVELVNDVKYASDVNYGHYSHNQFGGPYLVNNRAEGYESDQPALYKKYDSGYDSPSDPSRFVFGRFFVENSIMSLEQNKAIEKIVHKCLEAWWEDCIQRSV